MKSEFLLGGLAVIFILLFFITLRLVRFFIGFNGETRYITGELKRACEEREYHYWRKELRCHYLCLIPFVNEKNVRRLYSALFHKSEHRKK